MEYCWQLLLIETKTNFSCSSFRYSINAPCFSMWFVLWIFIQCFREMILLSTFWRIFLFHSINLSVVTLEFVEIIRSNLESKPVSISLLHSFQFIDIAFQKLGVLLIGFLHLELVVILRSSVETGPWFSSTKSLWFFTTTFYYASAICYISSFFIFLSTLQTAEGGSSIVHLLGKWFFILPK